MGATDPSRQMPAAVRVYGSLSALADAHGASLRYGAQHDLFRALEWFEGLATHGLPAALEPRIYVAEGAAPESFCVLYCAADSGRRRLYSLTSVYSVAYGPVFAPDSAGGEAPLAAILAFIRAERPRWRKVELRLLDSDNAATGWIERGLSRGGFRAHRFFQYENQFIATAGIGFEAYYASRASQVRNTIRRRERKLREGHTVEIVVATEVTETQLDDYAAVYGQSWKDPETAPGFIRELCRIAGRLGSLRLGLLYVDGAPAAAQLWLVSGQTAAIYKLAYDERFKAFSPGSILTREMMRQVLDEDRVAEIDYGIGSEDYKRDWMAESRQRVGIEAFNLFTLNGLVLAARQLVASVTARLHRLP